MVYIRCFVCGKERNKTPRQLLHTKHNFCSRGCYNIFQRLNRKDDFDMISQRKIKFFAECRRLKNEKKTNKT